MQWIQENSPMRDRDRHAPQNIFQLPEKLSHNVHNCTGLHETGPSKYNEGVCEVQPCTSRRMDKGDAWTRHPCSDACGCFVQTDAPAHLCLIQEEIREGHHHAAEDRPQGLQKNIRPPAKQGRPPNSLIGPADFPHHPCAASDRRHQAKPLVPRRTVRYGGSIGRQLFRDIRINGAIGFGCCFGRCIPDSILRLGDSCFSNRVGNSAVRPAGCFRIGGRSIARCHIHRGSFLPISL